MTARMVLRLSVIVQGLVIQFGLRLAPESLCLDAFSLRAPVSTSLENALDGLVTRFLGCPSRRSRAERGEDLAAAGGRETGAEAVTALAHQFAGLISPLHGSFSADRAICLINVMSPVMLAGPKRAIPRPK